jgi:hypothetical protein
MQLMILVWQLDAVYATGTASCQLPPWEVTLATVTATARHCGTATAGQPLPATVTQPLRHCQPPRHSHGVTATDTQPLPASHCHSHCATATAPLPLRHCHCHTATTSATVTLPLPATTTRQPTRAQTHTRGASKNPNGGQPQSSHSYEKKHKKHKKHKKNTKNTQKNTKKTSKTTQKNTKKTSKTTQKTQKYKNANPVKIKQRFADMFLKKNCGVLWENLAENGSFYIFFGKKNKKKVNSLNVKKYIYITSQRRKVEIFQKSPIFSPFSLHFHVKNPIFA